MFPKIIQLKADGDDVSTSFGIELANIPIASKDLIKITATITRAAGGTETAIFEFIVANNAYGFSTAPSNGWLSVNAPIVTAGPVAGYQQITFFQCDLTVNILHTKVDLLVRVTNATGGVLMELAETAKVVKLPSMSSSAASAAATVQPRIHTFAETATLTQTPALAYGIKSADLFRCTASFNAPGEVNAYAILKSTVIIQVSENPALVNVVLRPQQQSGIGIQPAVRYFIYRGLKKDDFLDAADPTKLRPYLNASEFIRKIYDEEALRQNVSANTLSLNATLLGIRPGQLPAETLDSYFFNKDLNFQHPVIFKGMAMGKFAASTTGTIGLDTITEGEGFKPDLALVRKAAHEVNVTIPPGLTDPQKAALRETATYFIDAAAYFGIHFYAGVIYPGSPAVVKKQQTLYNDIIAKFDTRNTVYVDIRNEHSYSYNYNKNYKDPGGLNDNNVNLGTDGVNFTPRVYETSSWPLITHTGVSTGNNTNTNKIYLQLRLNDNEHPILSNEYGHLIMPAGAGKMITDVQLVDPAVPAPKPWTKTIGFDFPNVASGADKLNVSTFIRLKYSRRPVAAPGTLVPPKVIESKHALANLMGHVSLEPLWDVDNDLITWETARSTRVVDFKDNVYDLADFVVSGTSGIYKEPQRVLFSYQPEIYLDEAPDPYAKGGPSAGVAKEETVFRTPVFDNYQLEITAIAEQATPGTMFNLLNLVPLGGSAGGNIMALGLSRPQLELMRAVAEELLSSLHRIYFTLNRIINTSGGTDHFTATDGMPYYKYTLKMQGWDKNDPSTAIEVDASNSVVSPSSPVIVYSSDNLLFTSQAFSNAEPPQTEYRRNYEEQQGEKLYHRFDGGETDHSITVEEHFYGLNTVLKTQVESFISIIAAITSAPASYAALEAEVIFFGQSIFNLAAQAVQVDDFINADDRPLYWARIRMAVALKSHPFCLANTAQGKKLVTLFEETSRNYTGVDYSAHPGLKKILVTGFDPFFLNEDHPSTEVDFNMRQSNPSGAAALGLHGKILKDATDNDYAVIQAMMVPVRYRDFDSVDNKNAGRGNGIVGKYIAPFINVSSMRVDMIVTISQSLAHHYDIDRFATRTRGGLFDNLDYKRLDGVSSTPLTQDELAEFEWIQTTLPKAMVPEASFYTGLRALGPYIIYAQHYKKAPNTPGDIREADYALDEITGIPFRADILGTAKKPTPTLHKGDKMYEGPGGNYLSNEIFYRVALVRERWLKTQPAGTKFATGHFHIAKLQDTGANFQADYTRQLILTVKDRINRGVLNLNNLFTNDI